MTTEKMSSEQYKDITFHLDMATLRKRKSEASLKRERKISDSAGPSTGGTKEITKGAPEVTFQPVVQTATSILIGLIFGIALEKGRVFEPEIIRLQMVFEKFVMLKMFVAATATGMTVFSILTLIPATHAKIAEAYSERSGGLLYKTHFASALGGLLLGAGMVLAGACPGTVFAQIGAGVTNSLYTLGGAATGGALYSMIHGVLPEFLVRKSPVTPKRLDEYIFVSWPYFSIALPMAAAMGAFVFVLESYVPWDSEVAQSGDDIVTMVAWPPFCSGMLIGSLQLPIVLLVGQTLGSSKSYMTVMAQTCRLCSYCPAMLDKFKSGMNNWAQVFTVTGIALGAHLSSKASGTHGSVAGVLPGFAFGGGMLMLFGARLAGGCTSGHGLSGSALLMTHSMLAVAAMFAGGIATAATLKYGLDLL